MLSLGPGVQVVLATEPVDLRRGHDGLVTLVRSLWRADPYSGTLFCFFGRRRDRVKILFFSAGGFVVYYKRLERGRFCMPHVPAAASQVEKSTLDAGRFGFTQTREYEAPAPAVVAAPAVGGDGLCRIDDPDCEACQ